MMILENYQAKIGYALLGMLGNGDLADLGTVPKTQKLYARQKSVDVTSIKLCY